jgi:formylglycine-generating enzyme required for sulfatase activity
MANFFAELKRRHIYGVPAACAVVLWGLVELLNSLTLTQNPSESIGTAEAAQHREAVVAQAAIQKPGTEFKDCTECPAMVVVPAGSFTMGSPASEAGRESDEGPQHQVTFSRALAVGKFEVTFAEWDACLSDGGCGAYRPSDDGWGRGNRPIIHVSWNDAQSYLSWVSRKTGKQYRLLSESEWEYAARAGTTTPFYWGGTASHDFANYGNDVCCIGLAQGSDKWENTSPVGSFPPNALGLYDMLGNVWEWTEDCQNGSYDGAPSDGSAWTAGDCSRHVLRGGSWFADPSFLRSAIRDWDSTGARKFDSGFRVARSF